MSDAVPDVLRKEREPVSLSEPARHQRPLPVLYQASASCSALFKSSEPEPRVAAPQHQWACVSLFHLPRSPSFLFCSVTVCGLNNNVLGGKIDSRCLSWKILTGPSGDIVSLGTSGTFLSSSYYLLNIPLVKAPRGMDANVS